MLNLAPGRNVIPGSEAMMSSYDRIMGEFGLDPQVEADENSRKIMKDFMEKANKKIPQGKGKFSKIFAPTAAGFNEYILADAAYNLHQGEGGKSYDERIAKGMPRYLAGIGGGNM
jgi:hypothetical protein